MVTAGGQILNEGQQYMVDYNLGRVKILDDGILSSGTPIKISLESNSLFSVQLKSLMGTHLDYKISKNANVGATIMRLTEKPLTQKVNIGDEEQKSGINKDYLNDFYSYCKNLNLDVVGLMCIPPADNKSEIFFKEMALLTKKLNLKELSMGMSADYIEAAKNSATYLRIGSNIFGKRS